MAQIKQEIRTISILCEGLYFFVARGLEVSVDTSLKGNKKPAKPGDLRVFVETLKHESIGTRGRT